MAYIIIHYGVRMILSLQINFSISIGELIVIKRNSNIINAWWFRVCVYCRNAISTIGWVRNPKRFTKQPEDWLVVEWIMEFTSDQISEPEGSIALKNRKQPARVWRRELVTDVMFSSSGFQESLKRATRWKCKWNCIKVRRVSLWERYKKVLYADKIFLVL